ncbi:tyrosine-type recombinase/integrase [Paludicola sp. MB14-C6]|nr:tyrosine-type recombinase/integrase [Paludicola sp. MB14-C6]WMJ24430.1 tyrosine-type recombinase/integrase [Paludicola sp. MB14-C6]
MIVAGIKPDGLSAHKLRHTAATLMYKYGHVDIRSLQQILNHKSIATTDI